MALATVVLLLALKMPLSRLDVPYTFAGDAIDKLAQIANVSETGWLFRNDRLGYPFGYDRLDFPRFDSLNYALLGPIAALSGAPGIAMNLYFIAGFFLIAFAAFYALRRLGLDTSAALVCALLYAFLPYHVIRGVAHLTNGAYFLVPLAMLALVWIAQDRFDPAEPGARRRWLCSLVIAVLVPLQMPYNGVFFAFLCVVAAAIAIAIHARWRSVLVALSLLAATGCAFVIEQLPVLLHAREAGSSLEVGGRTPVAAELYSLRLNQVLLPTSTDRRLTVARAAIGFQRAMNVPLWENRNQYIGAFGVLGFGALLWALFRAIGARGPPVRSFDDPEAAVRIAALFALAVLLLAISTGLGTLIAYWITAKIRAYNRVLPFFAFACLLGGGWLLQLATRRIAQPWLRNGVIVLVGVCALLDLLVRPPFPQRARDVADYDRDHAYFAGVEQRLGRGAAVFQLPVVWYPEHAPINEMGDYEEFKPFLLSETLRVSYGVASGRVGYSWNKYAENLPIAQMIEQAHAMGFAAILVDGSAYADDTLKNMTDALGHALREPASISTDRRWWLFPLDGCCSTIAQISPGNAPKVFAYSIGSGPVRFSAGESGVLYGAGGWNDPESWGMWALGPLARLRMRLDPPSGPLRATLDTQMMLGPNLPERSLRIDCRGSRIADVVYTPATATQRLVIDLPPGCVGDDGLLELKLATAPEATPQSAGVNDDLRPLGVGVVALSIDRAMGSP